MEARALASGDGRTLVVLFAAVLPGSPTALTSGLDAPEAFLEDPNSFVLGADADEAPVGLAGGLRMRSPSGRITTYLHELDVHHDWRRQGVGTALVTEAMHLVSRHGSTRCWLSTGGHHEIAHALYESLGGGRKPRGDVNYWWRPESDGWVGESLVPEQAP